jgi:hypothetical protein
MRTAVICGQFKVQYCGSDAYRQKPTSHEHSPFFSQTISIRLALEA